MLWHWQMQGQGWLALGECSRQAEAGAAQLPLDGSISSLRSITTCCCHVFWCVQCPTTSRLPALYLVDSIIKNVKEPYKSLFSQRLDQVIFSGKSHCVAPCSLQLVVEAAAS